MSQVQSFGSNCHRHSQSRKISIGVTVESSARRTLVSAEGQEVAASTIPMANCHQRDSISGAQVTTKAKQPEPLEKAGSPWITRKSHHEKSTTSQTASHANVNGFGTKMKTGGVHDQPNGSDGRPPDHGVKIFPTKASVLQPDSSFKGIPNGRVSSKKGETHVNSQTGDKFPCTVAQEQEALTSKFGDKAENTVNGKSETLRMKLWELLGTVSSPNKEKHDLQTLEVDGNSLQAEVGAKQAGARTVKHRQNSDTIETDSESPDCASKRPVTRSLTRKRTPTKVKQDTVKQGVPSASRQKPGGRNIFSFQEGWYEGLQGAAKGCPSTGNKRKNRRKSSEIEPWEISVQGKRHDKKSQQRSDKKQNPLTTDKSSSGCSSGETLLHVQSHVNGNNANPEGPTADKDFPKRTACKPVQHANITSPALPDYQDLQGDVRNSSSGNAVDPQGSQYSPKRSAGIEKHNYFVQIKRNEHRIGEVSDKNGLAQAAEKSGSHCSDANGAGLHGIRCNIDRKSINPRSTHIEKKLFERPARSKLDQKGDVNSPQLPIYRQREETESPGLPGYQSQGRGNRSSENIVDPQDGAGSPTFGRKSPIASHSFGARHKGSHKQQTAHGLSEPELTSSGGGIFSFTNFASKLIPNRNARDELRHSPPRSPAPQMQENDVDSSLPCSLSEDEEGPGAEVFSPETGTAEKPKFMLHRTKRLRSFDNILDRGFPPASVSPKVTRKDTSMQKPEQNVEEEEEDGLTRAIAILALALEKLKNKVKLLTTKKSSEILTSVAERIHSQLHNVESQIQADTCKLTSLSKQKRKRLETEFQEQEEQIKLIHGNLKKEIGRVLEGCKGTVEGLEDNHIELKGIADEQKSSHKKLLLQVQEAVETQLHDAEKRITAINQSAKEQMLQLKLVIAECLEGGVLS